MTADQQKTLRIACSGSMTVALAELVRFQGDLKDLPEENYVEFSGQMLRLGFSSPFHLWRAPDGGLRLVDGHQRLTTLTRMAAEGVEMPPVYPAVEVFADDEQQARQKVLALASQYGVVKEEGLRLFAMDAGLTTLELRRDFRLPEIDLKLLTLDPPPPAPEPPAAPPPPDDDAPEPVTVPKRVVAGDLWRLGRHMLVCGDSGDAAAMARLGAGGAAHALVSDPPYGLAFMGKAWDKAVPQTPLWKVWVDQLAPGAHLLVFSGTRTYHRATCALEDAGVEVRDQMQWLYGSGFPKSLNVSKAIDKSAGAEREVVGRHSGSGMTKANAVHGAQQRLTTEWNVYSDEPVTDAAREWDGFGTALKPANEPICVARKPFSGTIAECVQKHGTGGLNIGGTRIGTDTLAEQRSGQPKIGTFEREDMITPERVGRFPANVIFSHSPECVQTGTRKVTAGTAVRHRSGGKNCHSDEVKPPMPDVTYGDTNGEETVEAWNCAPDCAVRMLDEQSGPLKSGGAGTGQGSKDFSKCTSFNGSGIATTWFGDAGGASRFFYCAKSSRADRGEGNTHATVKPMRLMEYLVRLVTADGQTVLEPFCGSGTTLLACERTGRRCLASELDPAHCDIILARFEALAGVAPVLVERLNTEPEK